VTSFQANLSGQEYQLPGADLQADQRAELNLIPAAADATKKESKIRNIATVWSRKIDNATPQSTEAKK
jgi:hypothetical protein